MKVFVGSFLFWLVVAFLSNTTNADDAEYELQPLKYNNPGLKVDLGVGLWAYPLPMDFDGDGDLDLVVSCPDKPSGGTYFFENPTQDPAIQMPVFEPAVRVGDGHHYMMLSRVGDEDIVLRPGKAYRAEASSGRIDFAAADSIKLPVDPKQFHSGRTRGNMWRYVDYDGDGDQDLAIGIGDWSDFGWDHAYDNNGRWRNGPLHGYVYVVTNLGSDQQPRYSDKPFRIRAGGGDVDVYGWPSPNFADFDGDGDLDLLCGEFLDGFTYFQNIGTRKQPEYGAGMRLADADGTPLAMHLQMITPTAVDWDADGDLDLIVGDEDGRVAFVENTGRLVDSVPQFEPPRYFRQEADTLKFGALATPFVYDWDGDGDQDIICGNTAGSIGLFENLGSGVSGTPKWDAPKLLKVKSDAGRVSPFRIMAGQNGSIQGPCEAKWGYTTLSVADWDSDGDGDIIYNSIHGRIGILIRDGDVLRQQAFDTGRSELPPAWDWRQNAGSDSLTQWRTTPVAVDFDGDSELDLVVLDQAGFLTLRRGGEAAERIFVDDDDSPIRLNAGTCGRSGRVKLAVADWDGDGRLDLLVNSENATWYRNREDRDGTVVLRKMGNLARRNVAGHTSSPAVCDFDSDGKLDLLVGSENGRIYHIQHDDCVAPDQDELTLPQSASTRNESGIPGLITSEFVFGNAPFEQCHASTICQTSRGLVVSWFGGTKEGNKDVGIWTSYHDGQKWNGPNLVADGVQYVATASGDGLRYPCWNPVLYQPPGDAPTLLFFKVGPSPSKWWGEVMISYDRGRTFRDRRRLPEGIDGPVRCKPVLLDDGKTLLCGSSTEYDGWRVHFERVSLVDGLPQEPWQRIGPINDASQFNAIQPTILKHRSDTGELIKLQALCRTKEGVIASTVSADGGNTWQPLRATDLPNPNSGIEAVTLADGRHLLVYNRLDSGKTGWGRRGLLNLAVSDDGVSWRDVAVLENEKNAEFSYPAMIQASDGAVHITYTHKRRKIKHVVLDPSKI